MTTIAHLTTLEFEVLQALGMGVAEHEEDSPDDTSMGAGLITEYGRQLFGPEWCPTYFILDSALGRLRRKGFAERHEPDYTWLAQTTAWGVWNLTPSGRDLLGLPPLHGS